MQTTRTPEVSQDAGSETAGALRRIALAATLLLPALAHSQTPQVATLEHDGSSYVRYLDNAVPNSAPREVLARQFYQAHGDDYDFIVVFPTFATPLVRDVGGLYSGVRSAELGIGVVPYDRSDAFGSRGRLQGFIDILSLAPGATASSVDDALGILAHEVLHRWAAHVSFRDPATSAERRDLLGQEGAHWSAFLDTGGSVLYGSTWLQAESGAYEAGPALVRYSPLDLYLMGLAPASEVNPLTLLHPVDPTLAATSLPPPEGFLLRATPETVLIEQIVSVEGSRVPAAGAAQAVFRVAFAVATGPGQSPTPEQFAFVDEVRRRWANTFFFLTGGRGLMETDLSSPSAQLADHPGVSAAIDWLVARQAPDGSWADDPATRTRDSGAALEALAPFYADTRVSGAIVRGGDLLGASAPADVDSWARRMLALNALGRSAAGTPPAGACTAAGACGLASGYLPTVLDTALALSARLASGEPPPSVAAGVAWLIARQNADGGWPFGAAGPSRIEPTARVLEVLARVPRTYAVTQAGALGAHFLNTRYNGAFELYVEEGQVSAAAAALAVRGLFTWGESVASRAARALLGLQQADGSWEGAVHATSQVLRVLRAALLPNLRAGAGDVHLARTSVAEGETVGATISVHLDGYLASTVAVQAFDGAGQPFGPAVVLAGQDFAYDHAPGRETLHAATVQLVLDTTGHAGSDTAYVVVDPDGRIAEWSEVDNRVAVPLLVSPGGTTADPYVAAGSIATSPAAIAALPLQLQVTATVGNAGLEAATAVPVRCVAGGLVVASATVDLLAQSRRAVTFSVPISAVAGALQLSVVVEPGAQNGRVDNDRTDAVVPVVSTVDVAVAGLFVPAEVPRGGDVAFTVTLANGGTRPTSRATVRASIVDATTRASVGTIPPVAVAIPGGGTASLSLPWTARALGPMEVAVTVGDPSDIQHANDTATARFRIAPPAQPNLALGADSVSVDPVRPLVGQPATLSATVVNSGGVAAGSFVVSFAVAGTVVARQNVAGLEAGASSTVTAPWTPAAPTDGPIAITADVDDAVTEFDETDNQRVLEVHPLPIPDLVLAEGDLTVSPAFPRPNATVQVTVSVLNGGGQPSQATSVSLYEGDPATGRLVGTAALPRIAAEARAQAVFSWSTAGLSGAQRLVAIVNPDRSAPEASYDNDRAERTVLVQDAAVMVSEPYFSPNADGVKDTTDVVFALPAGTAASVQFIDAKGKAARTLPVAAGPAFATVSWDGRDGAGHLVRDGTYYAVVTTAGAASAPLGRAQITVDTNRYPLHEVVDPALLHTTFLGNTPRQAVDPLDRGIVFFRCGTTLTTGWQDEYGQHPCGIFLRPPEGGPPELLTPPDWVRSNDELTSVLAISPDGDRIAFVSRSQKIRVFSRSSQTTTTLATTGVLGQIVPPSGDIAAAPHLEFTPDGERVWFQTGDVVQYWMFPPLLQQRYLESVGPDGVVRPELTLGAAMYSSLPYGWKFDLSPDGSRVAFAWTPGTYAGGGLAVFDVTGQLLELDRTPQIMSAGEAVWHAWMPGSERMLAYSNTLMTGTWMSAWHLLSAGAEIVPGSGWSATGVDITEALSLGCQAAVSPLEDAAIELCGWGPERPAFVSAPVGSPRREWGGDLGDFPRTELAWSPGGSFLTSWDPSSQPGVQVLGSYANMSARISAVRIASRPGIVFEGTAADLNFLSYAVRVRSRGGEWTEVVRSIKPVLEGRLGEWVPLSPGVYDAELVIEDLAGNTKTRKLAFGWSESPELAGITAAPRYMSPNGDDVQDTTLIKYTVARATTARFEVVNDHGAVVRVYDRTHLVPGEYVFEWDGNDGQGRRVGDGEYVVRADGIGTVVVVDTTPPDVFLSWWTGKNQKEQSKTRHHDGGWQVYTDDGWTGPTAADGAGRIGYWTRREVMDRYLDTWWMESSPASGTATWTRIIDPSSSRAGLNSADAVLSKRLPPGLQFLIRPEQGCGITCFYEQFTQATGPLTLEEVRGHLIRLHARDLAGNEWVTDATAAPERLFLLGAGTADSILQAGVAGPDGRLIFPVDRLETRFSESFRVKAADHWAELTELPSWDDRIRLPREIDYFPRRWGFALATTLGEPVVDYQITYDIDGVPHVALPSAVQSPREEIVLWDGTDVPLTPDKFTITAYGASGRSVSTTVPFRRRSGLTVCSSPEQLRVESDYPATLGLGNWGGVIADGRLLFTRAGRSEPELVVPLDSSGVSVLPREQLPGCQYHVEFQGTTVAGGSVSAATDFDACGVKLLSRLRTADALLLRLGETFRGALGSVKVFVKTQETPERLLATVPAFSGETVAAVPWTGDCADAEFRLEPVLADGSRHPEHEQYGFSLCDAEESRFCPRVGVTLLRSDAPSCSYVEPAYVVSVFSESPTSIEAAVSVGSYGVSKWFAKVTPDVRLMTSSLLPAIPPNAPWTRNEWNAEFSASALTEGGWIVRTELFESAGGKRWALPAIERLVTIDRTPPRVEITYPVAGQSVCPARYTQPNGTMASSLPVEGTIADPNLEGNWLLTLRKVGAPVPHVFYRSGSARGELHRFPLDPLGRGEMEISAEARDVSGGSVCVAPFRFTVYSDVTFTGVTPDPVAFSPDRDGFADTTTFRLALTGSGTVTATGTTADGPVLLFTEAVQPGAASVQWNGVTAGGTAIADGALPVRLDVTDACGTHLSRDTVVEIDTTPPQITVAAPAVGGHAIAGAPITGEIADSHLQQYEIRLVPAAGTAVLLAAGVGPVSGVLAVLPADIAPGAYDLAITATDTVGHPAERHVAFTVDAPSLLASFSVAPAAISPNGDGTLDQAWADVVLAGDATLRLTLVDAAGTAVMPLVPPTPLAAGSYRYAIDAALLGGVLDGSYQVLAEATGGTSESALRPLAVDLTPPSIDVSAPAAGAFVAGAARVTLSIDDLRLASWSVGVRNAQGHETTLAQGKARVSGPVAALDGLADGSYTLVVRAADSVGNPRTLEVPFQSDATAPKVAFRTPLSGDVVSDRAGVVHVGVHVEEANLASARLEAVDPTSGSTTVVFSAAVLATPDPDIEWDVSGVAEGPVRLRLTVTDRAGNVGTAEIALTVDRTPPVAKIQAPRGGYVTAALPVTGTVEDTNLGHWLLELAPGEAGSGQPSFFQIARGTASATGDLAQLSPLPADGRYTLRLTAVDRAGATATDQTSFVVDTVAPGTPTGVVAAGAGPRAVALHWDPNPETDLAGYLVFRGRGSAAMTQLTPSPNAANAYQDLVPADAQFRYQIVAVDLAGNRSGPSTEVSVAVDSTPPIVAITVPRNGAQVGGRVGVTGTAAANDLARYRLTVAPAVSPAAEVELAAGTTSVRGGPLGVLDAAGLAEGSSAIVRLMAVDAAGNAASTAVSVLIDNTPPARPTLLSATAAGSTVTATWAPSAEADLAGYVLFRNGMPVGAAEGADLSDLTRFLLAPTTTRLGDPSLADGTYVYELQAFDQAGNGSARSNAITVSIDQRTPAARIVSPANLARISGPVTLVAAAADRDLAAVRFEARAGGGAFAPLGAEITAWPYVAVLDPAAFTAPVIEVRAVARDLAGHEDQAPASIVLFHDTAPSAPAVSALVDGQDVQLSWTDGNAPGAIAGYRVARDGAVLATATRPAGSASATSGSATAALAYDAGSYTVWTATAALPQAWTVDLTVPTMLRTVSTAASYASWTADLQVKVRGTWVTVASPVQQGATISIDPPLEAEAVRLQFKTSSRTYVDLAEVTLGAEPLVAVTTVVDAGVAIGNHSYEVAAVTPFGLSDRGTAAAEIYEPTLQALADPVPGPTVVLRGVARASASILVIRDGIQVAAGTAAADGAFAVEAPVVPGANTFTVRAVDGAGNRSLPAAPVSTTCVPPPTATIALSLTRLAGAEASLAFDVSGADSSVAGYLVKHATGSAALGAWRALDAAARSFETGPLPNETHRFQVVAVNAVGIEGAPSNVTSFSVAVTPPQPPSALAISAPRFGQQLRLTWGRATGDATYAVDRAAAAAGPFERVAVQLTGPEWIDRSVANGTEYFYRVVSLDGAGNASAPSNTARGVPHRTITPAPPVLTNPTTAAAPISLPPGTVGLGGYAETGTDVELWRDGRSLGRAALPSDGASGYRTEWQLSSDVATPIDVGLGGRVAVHGSFSQTTGRGVVSIEDLATHTLRVAEVSGLELTGWPVVSPDGARAAVGGVRASDGGTRLVSIELATGAVTELPASCAAGDPAWSLDGARLAYPCASNGRVGVASLTLATGVETMLDPAPAGDALRVAWAWGDRIVALLQPIGASVTWGLAAFDPAGGTTTAHLADAADTSPLAVSPGGDLVAFTTPDTGDVAVLDLVNGGGPAAITQDGPWPASLVFAPDERAVAYGLGRYLWTVEVAGGATSQLGRAFAADRLVWPEGRGIVVSSVGATPEEWIRGGEFLLADVPLNPGENAFTGVAADAWGNRSREGDAISVTVEGGGTLDLAVAASVDPALPVRGGPANVSVRVTNQGTGGSPSTVVALAVIDEAGATRWTASVPVPAMGPQESRGALVALDTAALAGSLTLVAEVDRARVLPDIDRTNDRVTVPFQVVTASGLQVAVVAAPASVAAGGTITATATAVNPGASTDVTVRIALLDASGALVLADDPANVAPLAGGSSTTLVRQLPVGSIVPGRYEVVAELIAAGSVASRASAPVTVLPDRTVALSLAPLRSTFVAGGPIQVLGSITNRSANAPLDGATYSVSLFDGNGAPVATSVPQAVPYTWLGASTRIETDLPSAAVPAGSYEARATLTLAGQAIAQAKASVVVVGRPALVGAVAVEGAGDPIPAVGAGSDLRVTFSLRNDGAAASQIGAARLVVIDPDTLAAVETAGIPVSALAPAGAYQGTQVFPTTGLGYKTYAVALIADHDGVGGDALALTRFRVADPAPPALILLNLPAGLFVRGSVTPRVRATDDRTGTAEVRVTVDGAAPTPLALADGSALDGLWSATIPLDAEGVHTLTFSARDAEGNDGAATPGASNPVTVNLVSDTISPAVGISGVVAGACYAQPPVPVAIATDVNLAVARVTLDGAAFVAGSAVSTDGDHTFSVSASDRAGNDASAAVSFVVDRTAPQVAISGAVEGQFAAMDVSYAVSAVDARLVSLAVTVDGSAAGPSGTVTAEGAHTIDAQAVDCAGNAGHAVLRFTVDKTPPTLALIGVSDGATYQSEVVPAWTATDANLGTVTATLNGAPFSSGTPVASDGNYLLEVVAVDQAGNRTARSAAFVVDRTAPVIRIAGFTEGSYVAGTVFPSYAVAEANLDRVDATIDGLPFVDGLGVTGEGLHVFSVVATDDAGNRAEAQGTFTIDVTPPTVALSGFVDGSVVNVDVAPSYRVTEVNLASVRATLDGLALQLGYVVTAEGDHRVEVVAQDLAGNATTVSGRFEIDRTPPTITASVREGDTFSSAVAPTFGAADVHLTTVTATLDGSPFASGTTVGSEGAHTLLVSAHDLAGNSARAVYGFRISTAAVSGTVTAALDRSPRVLVALNCAGQPATCQDAQAHVLLDVLSEAAIPFDVTLDAPAFLARIRENRHNVTILYRSGFYVDGEAWLTAYTELGEQLFEGGGVVRVSVDPTQVVAMFGALAYDPWFELVDTIVVGAGTVGTGRYGYGRMVGIAFDPELNDTAEARAAVRQGILAAAGGAVPVGVPNAPQHLALTAALTAPAAGAVEMQLDAWTATGLAPLGDSGQPTTPPRTWTFPLAAGKPQTRTVAVSSGEPGTYAVLGELSVRGGLLIAQGSIDVTVIGPVSQLLADTIDAVTALPASELRDLALAYLGYVGTAPTGQTQNEHSLMKIRWSASCLARIGPVAADARVKLDRLMRALQARHATLP